MTLYQSRKFCSGKRYVLAIAFIIILPVFGIAQRFKIGVKAGLSLNYVGFGEEEDKQRFSRGLARGYTGGLLVGFPLGKSKRYELITEGAFSRKGKVLKFNDNTWTNTQSFNMIDATMLLRRTFHFHIREDLPAEWFFNIGPEVSHWLSGKGAFKADGPEYDYKMVFNGERDGSLDRMYVAQENRWLFGLALGVGFTAPLRNNQKLTTELRFISGHTFLSRQKTFNPNDYPVVSFEETLRTNLKVFNITLAYTYDFSVQESRKGKSTIKKKLKKGR